MGIGDRLTQRIIHCIIQVHRTLGPGFLEVIYRRALLIELAENGLAAAPERRITVLYRGREVGRHVLDMVVEGQVIIELKNVNALSKAHYAQVRSYLRASGLPVALLVNLAGDLADFRRVEG